MKKAITSAASTMIVTTMGTRGERRPEEDGPEVDEVVVT